jgi:hypothetical protein
MQLGTLVLISSFILFIFVIIQQYISYKRKLKIIDSEYNKLKQKYKNVYRLAVHEYNKYTYFQVFQCGNGWKNLQLYVNFDGSTSIEEFFIKCVRDAENKKINYGKYVEIE